MTEQEKRRRRREMERRMRTGRAARGRDAERGGLFSFRLYVTAVLVGGCFLLSLFDTETANAFCGQLKATVSAQISAERLQEWRAQAEDFLRERALVLPVFGEKEATPQQEQEVYLPDTEDSP